MRDGLAVGVVGLACVLPWTTWARLSAPTAELAMLATPLLLLTLAALGMLAAIVSAADPWLGAFVAYAAGLVLVTQSSYALETAQWIAIGAALLHAARDIKKPGLAVHALVGIALGQCAYVALQHARFDPLFAGTGITRVLWPGGTLGNPDWTAALIAPVVPLAAWPVALVLLVGLALTKSTVGLAAALLGLAVRYRSRWTLALLAVGAVVAPLIRNVSIADGLAVRRDVYTLGLTEWWSAGWLARVLGIGPGEWWTTFPPAQHRTGVAMLEGPFVWAHSDALQLLYEFGAVGALMAVGWLAWHRRAFTGPYGGALVALLVESLVFFPWHLPCVVAVALVIIGLATPHVARPRTFALDLSRRVVFA